MREEAHDENGSHAIDTQPFVDHGSCENAVHLLFEDGLRSESSLWSETWRELGAPGSWQECRAFMRFVVVTNPGDRSSFPAGAVNLALDCRKRCRVVRYSPLATGGKFILRVDNQ